MLLLTALGAELPQKALTPGNASSKVRSWNLDFSEGGHAGFTLLPPEATGVSFTNVLAASRSITNHVLLNGSGVAAGDIDGDGRVDLYFCGLDNSNRLFRNLGDWRFQDVTDLAGVGCVGTDSTGAAFADLDGDGDLDLVVNSITQGTRVFLNDSKGRFQPSAANSLLNEGQAGTSLALADMDGDGALDLYVANYRPMFFFLDKPETRYSIRTINGQPQVALIDGRPLTDPDLTNRFIFQLQAADGKITLGKEEVGQVDALYHNDGQGRFHAIPWTGGAFLDEDGKTLLAPPRDWGLSVMFRDLNGDGLPDLYVCNDFRTPDRIWWNQGQGRFRAAPRLALRHMCLSAMGLDVADVNRDGWFDIFVADMLSTDHARRLVQRIDLRPETTAIGAIENRPQYSKNVLQLSRGDGTFLDIADLCGLEASDWTWSPIFLDVDLDGFEDLIIANGFERDTMNMDAQHQFESMAREQKLTGLERLKLRRLYPRLNTANLAFRNLGGSKFENVSKQWAFDTPAISQGMCLADLDNDGDLDVIVNNMNSVAGLYRNDSSAPRLAVRLRGSVPNTHGIGARIEVFGGPVYQSQEMICGGRYCSSDDTMRTFACGSLTNEMTIVVTWRSGARSIVEGARGNRLYEVVESERVAGQAEQALPTVPSNFGRQLAAFPSTNRSFPILQASIPGQASRTGGPPPTGTSVPKPYFRDVSDRLSHTHQENGFDDFVRQPLLSGKLSQSGPGVSWCDLDQDGWEDLIVGTGRGGRLGVYRNDQNGGFKSFTPGSYAAPLPRDSTTILGWQKPGEPFALLVGLASDEDGQTNAATVMEFDGIRGMPRAVIPGSSSSCSALAMADIDNDGDLDLFVAGRVVPGRYPEAASSRLFRNERGTFQLDESNTQALAKVGMVTGAVFSDLDGDGQSDLVVACDWGPIRVFRNNRGVFEEQTQALGLDKFTGWWTGVNVGDFNGDGRLDIVAGNWGKNSRYEIARSMPLRLYYGDFNGDGSVQTLEAYFDPARKTWVPWRRLDEVAKVMPFVNAAFGSFEEFGRADVAGILGDRTSRATVLEANWLESTLFINRTDRWEASPLPLEAQISPAFAICVGDLDGDGLDDLFLSQNFFAVAPEMARYDAGRSLWLRGNGAGQFQAISGMESGLLVYGEQRGAALCDYDHDGRLDLVVSENGAATKLYHNETGLPGLRVRVRGAKGNPYGIGAAVRLKTPNGVGPTREIRAGAGYWSQDSATLLISTTDHPESLEVRWPGGRWKTVPIPEGAREIEIGEDGSSQRIK